MITSRCGLCIFYQVWLRSCRFWNFSMRKSKCSPIFLGPCTWCDVSRSGICSHYHRGQKTAEKETKVQPQIKTIVLQGNLAIHCKHGILFCKMNRFTSDLWHSSSCIVVNTYSVVISCKWLIFFWQTRAYGIQKINLYFVTFSQNSRNDEKFSVCEVHLSNENSAYS